MRWSYNAGIAIFKPILDVTYEDWSRVLAVNLTGPFLCTQAAAPLIRDSGGGAIVNITSISGLRASTLRTAYGTSKAGLAHLTKQQAAELASLGIRVNAVAPGPVDTAMAKAVHTPEIRKDYHDHMPLNRYGLEEELAEVIFFLCSDARELRHRTGDRGRRRLRLRPASACRRCARKNATAEKRRNFQAVIGCAGGRIVGPCCKPPSPLLFTSSVPSSGSAACSRPMSACARPPARWKARND